MRRFIVILLVLLFGAFLLGSAWAHHGEEDSQPCDSGNANNQNPHCDADEDGVENRYDNCPHYADPNNDCAGAPAQQGPGNPNGNGPGEVVPTPAEDCIEYSVQIGDQVLEDPSFSNYVAPQSGDPAPVPVQINAGVGDVSVSEEYVVDPPPYEVNADATVVAGCVLAAQTQSQVLGVANEAQAEANRVVSENKP